MDSTQGPPGGNTGRPGRDRDRDRLARYARRWLGRAPGPAWPRPGDDTPRLTWPAWLRRQADAYRRAGTDATVWAADLLEQAARRAEDLGAWSPAEHVVRAAREAVLGAGGASPPGARTRPGRARPARPDGNDEHLWN